VEEIMRILRISALVVALALLACGCAGSRDSGKYRYRFAGERTAPTTAKVMNRHEATIKLSFESEPSGADIYAYDPQGKQKGDHLGRAPFDKTVLCFHVTEYSDLTRGYEVIVHYPHEVTRSIDFADPEAQGEITFSFLFEKKGYEDKIERISVKATHDELVKALSGEELPSYYLKVLLEVP